MSREAAIEEAGGQFALHRAAHRLWRRVALVLVVVVVLQAGAVVGLVLRDRPVDRAYAATPDGRVIELTPLEQPVMSQAALRSWVVRALSEALTMGHHDYRLRLGQVAEFFTDEGYESYTEQLGKSQVLERIREYRQVAAAVAREVPVITKASKWKGRGMWTLEVPMALTFYAGNRKETVHLLVSVLVMRVKREERPAGIGIQQIVAERVG